MTKLRQSYDEFVTILWSSHDFSKIKPLVAFVLVYGVLFPWSGYLTAVWTLEWTAVNDDVCAVGAKNQQQLQQNATIVAGHAVLLECQLPVGQQDVIWLRPSDGLPLTAHASNSDRFVLMGNSSAGQHHLLIRYSVLREDAGLWTCVSAADSRLLQQTQLTVLAPPATQVMWLCSSVGLYSFCYWVLCVAPGIGRISPLHFLTECRHIRVACCVYYV